MVHPYIQCSMYCHISDLISSLNDDDLVQNYIYQLNWVFVVTWCWSMVSKFAPKQPYLSPIVNQPAISLASFSCLVSFGIVILSCKEDYNGTYCMSNVNERNGCRPAYVETVEFVVSECLGLSKVSKES